MLSLLQQQKLTHYFNVLDADNSGTLEQRDFERVGENLAILWGFSKGSSEFLASMARCKQIWGDFRVFIGKASDDKATLEEWLTFADANIVNGDDARYERHVNKVALEIINLFDVDRDDHISLVEYLNLFLAYQIEIRYSIESFERIDKNGDGLISKDELLSAIREYFRSEDEQAPGNWLFGFWENHTGTNTIVL